MDGTVRQLSHVYQSLHEFYVFKHQIDGMRNKIITDSITPLWNKLNQKFIDDSEIRRIMCGLPKYPEIKIHFG